MPLFGRLKSADIYDMKVKQDVKGLINAFKRRPNDLDDFGRLDDTIRREAARALGELKAAQAVPYMIAALNESGGDSLAATAEALGKIGDPRAIEPLFETAQLPTNSELFRLASITALGKLGVEAIDNLARILLQKSDDEQGQWKYRAQAATSLGETGDRRAVAALIDALKDDREEVRRNAAAALGECRDPSAVPGLLELAASEPCGVRDASVRSLGQIGDKRAVDTLIGMLSDGAVNENARIGPCTALGKIGDPRAVEALLGVLRYPLLGSWAAKSLGEIGAESIGPLIEALRNSEDMVRANAAVALGIIGDPGTVAPLREIAEDKSNYVRHKVMEAIKAIQHG